MTGQYPSRLSEFTWYSRLAAWIGAAMLLVQSVFGRDAGPVTVLAVLLLGIGFLCFLIGLAVDSHVPGTGLLIGPRPSDREPNSVSSAQPAMAVAKSDAIDVQGANAAIHPGIEDAGNRAKLEKRADPSPVVADPVARGPGRRPKFRERAKKTDSRPQPREKRVQAPVPPEERESRDVSPRTESPLSGVTTEMLSPGHSAVGAQCPRCGSSLRVGQLAANCPVCGRTNHATCWMENHFHCAVPACAGHGSLEAPADSAESGQSNVD